MKEEINGKLIKDFILENHLTYEEFAKMCDLEVDEVINIITQSKSYRKILSLFKIARAMNAGIKDLYM